MLSILRDPRAAVLLLASTLTVLSNTLISPALPGLEARFADASNAGLLTRLLVTAPSIAVALFAPFAGGITDRFGRRRQLLLGVALFGIAGSAGLWLPELWMILASRLVLGLSVALIMTAQTALIGDYFSGAARGRFMGIQIAATNFGGLIFLMFAGWLAGMSPVLPFVIYAVALLYLPWLFRYLEEPDRQQGHTPAATATAEAGWIGALVVVLVLAALSFASFYLIPTQAPYYLAQIGHPEPAAASLLLAMVTLAGGVVSLLFGRIRQGLGRAGTPAVGYGFFAAGFAVMAVADGLTAVLAAAALLGIGTGLIMPTFLSIALDIAPAHRRGMAAGAVTTSIFLGQFLSPFLGNPLIAALGYGGAFWVAAMLVAGLGVVCLIAFRAPGRDDGLVAANG